MRVNSTWVGGLSVSVTLCRSDMGHRRFFFTDEAFSLQTLKNAQMSTAMPRWTDDEPGQGAELCDQGIADQRGMCPRQPGSVGFSQSCAKRRHPKNSFSSGGAATRERKRRASVH